MDIHGRFGGQSVHAVTLDCEAVGSRLTRKRVLLGQTVLMPVHASYLSSVGVL